ncbi:MAG: hypothetical protein ACK5MD_00295 [Flavobacteriales bacterium]
MNLSYKRKIFLILTVFSYGIIVFGQVGINTESPKATLDVVAKDGVAGAIIAPRLTGEQIKDADSKYDATREGAIVYATAPVTVATTKTANITEEGYYYFDGSIWVAFKTFSKTAFVPYVIASGRQKTATLTQTDNGQAFKQWDFTPIINDNNWDATNHYYTVPQDGYYQFSLEGIVHPNKDTNSFLWVLRKDTSEVEYVFTQIENVRTGPTDKPYEYNKGGITVLYLTKGTQIDFGSIANGGASTNYEITNRLFVVMFLGQ